MNINIYNPYVRSELELMHHGILGQRWGKKNGPPYPLGASDHSASEKKAGWRKSLDSGGQTRGEARKYTRKLNRLDKLRAEDNAHIQRLRDKNMKITEKYAKSIGKNGTNVKKTLDKINKNSINRKAFEKHLQRCDEVIADTLKEMNDKGYKMSSDHVTRRALQGETLAGYYIGGIIGASIIAKRNEKYVLQEGTKFKVQTAADNQILRDKNTNKTFSELSKTFNKHHFSYYLI